MSLGDCRDNSARLSRDEVRECFCLGDWGQWSGAQGFTLVLVGLGASQNHGSFSGMISLGLCSFNVYMQLPPLCETLSYKRARGFVGKHWGARRFVRWIRLQELCSRDARSSGRCECDKNGRLHIFKKTLRKMLCFLVVRNVLGVLLYFFSGSSLHGAYDSGTPQI